MHYTHFVFDIDNTLINTTGPCSTDSREPSGI